MHTWAVLVAAGRGERIGSACPKAFLELGGRPLLAHAAEALGAATCVDAIVAVVPPGHVDLARRLLAPLAKLAAVVEGGARRQDSVLAGLKQVPASFAGVVLVHDAARALVEPPLVDSVALAAARHGAALPVLALVDTIKRVSAGLVVETVDRATLGAAQTPQGFRFELLSRAYEAAHRDGVLLTDESMAVERLGERVATVPGSRRNRKITTPEDLEWAESVLQREAACQPPRASRAGA